MTVAFDLIRHISYLQRGLLAEHEFCFLRALDYYRSEYQQGGLIIVPGREITQRAGKCTLCGKKIAKGAPKFLSRSVGWVHFDTDCASRIWGVDKRKVVL